MQIIAIKAIDYWLEHQAELDQQAVFLTNETGLPIRCNAACDLFLQAFAHLFARFGSPDHPGRYTDWRGVLRVHSPLLAVWDFDYYQLSLSTALEAAIHDEGYRVVLTRYVPLCAQSGDFPFGSEKT